MPRSRKPPKTDPNLAIAYLRASTDDQLLSADAQRYTIERWAEQRKATIHSWHTDQGVSGGAPLDKRPALVEALQTAAEQRAGLLVVAKRDRLARDVVIAITIEKFAASQGCRVVSADGVGDTEDLEDPSGILTRGMMDLIAQFERAMIRQRTKHGLAVKKRRGERVGRIPYGKRLNPDGKTLDDDPDELATIAKLRELRASGLTLRAVVKEANRIGLPARGKCWHLTTVAKLVG